MFGDLGVNFPGRLISRGFGHGFGLFGLAKTFLGSRYHAGPPGNRAVSAGIGPGRIWGFAANSRGRWGLLMRRQGDGEDDNAVARNSFLRLFDGGRAGRGGDRDHRRRRRVRLVELADRTVMVEIVVVLVSVVDQIRFGGGGVVAL